MPSKVLNSTFYRVGRPTNRCLQNKGTSLGNFVLQTLHLHGASIVATCCQLSSRQTWQLRCCPVGRAAVDMGIVMNPHGPVGFIIYFTGILSSLSLLNTHSNTATCTASKCAYLNTYLCSCSIHDKQQKYAFNEKTRGMASVGYGYLFIHLNIL